MPINLAKNLALAAAHCDRGQFELAAALLRQTVQSAPQEPEAWLLLARIELQSGRLDQAFAAADGACRLNPRNPDARYLLGRVHKARGELEAADAQYRLALEARPDDPELLTSLGIVARAQGRLDDAAARYRRALELKPELAAAAHNLERVLLAVGAGAAAKIQGIGARAVYSSDLIPALRNSITALASRGQIADAWMAARVALSMAPEAADLWFKAGWLAIELGRMPDSLPFLQEAVRLDPMNHDAVDLARHVCVGAGLTEQALHYSELEHRIAPSEDLLIMRKFVLPAIPRSLDEIHASRLQYESALDSAINRAASWRDPFNTLQLPTFFLAYHGENDRDLQQKAARLHLGAIPGLDMVAPHCQRPRRPGKIRVGFISRYFAAHSIAKTSRGLIEKLNRELFDVSVLRISPSSDDDTARQISAAADRTIALSVDIARARDDIAALELDILFYQDIGMEPTSWFLAFARLAPVQCVSFGHPNTTGIPNVDFFVSNDLYETAEAPSHYSERLFLLRDLPTLAYYYKPAMSGMATREDFGIPANANVYLCPQTLFKLHPNFDVLLDRILAADPRGIVVLIGGHFAQWTNLLRRRLYASMPATASRVMFLPAMPMPKFLQLLAVGDVALDTPQFNGMNSSLESFAVGTPVVTLPTTLQRGRHTQAMWKSMGILDCIAANSDDYVAIALRLGTDREYARAMRARILERNYLLYEDERVVREFERFFVEAMRIRCEGA